MVLMSNEEGIYFRSPDCSINALKEISEKCPVIRTAHPGNFDYVTLALAKHFKVLLREDITGDADIYMPGYIRDGQTRTLITDHSTYAVPFIDIRNPDFIKEVYSLEAKTALQLHYRSLQNLDLNVAPSIDVVTDISSLEDIISIIIENCPQHFEVFYDASHQKYRFTKSIDNVNIYKSANGEKHSIEHKDLATLFFAHIKRIKVAYRGDTNEQPMPSVDGSNAFFHVLLLASLVGRDKRIKQVYHLCGTRMYDYLYRDSRYAPKNQEELRALYNSVSKFGFVPKHIVFNLIPTTQLRPFVNVDFEQAYKAYRAFLEKEMTWNAKKREIVENILQQYPWQTQEEVITCTEHELLKRRTKPKTFRRIMRRIKATKDIDETKGYAISCLYPSSLFPEKENVVEEIEFISRFRQQELGLGSQYDIISSRRGSPSLPDFVLEMTPREIALLWKKFSKL